MQFADDQMLPQHGAWQQQLAGHQHLLFRSVEDVLPLSVDITTPTIQPAAQ
jgi:hypothetical protein